MNLPDNPSLIDQLAASYALGTLRGGARRRFEALARDSVTVRAQALIWQERMATLTELQPAQAPSANVWKRIENQIAAERAVASRPVESTSMLEGLRRSLFVWRGTAFAGALATVAAGAIALQLNGALEDRSTQLAQATTQRSTLAQQNAQLAAQLQAAPDIQYVAVLADDKADASVLVTFDPRRQSLVLKRVGNYREASDRSLQLWALPPAGGPQSLGVMGGEAVVKLTAAPGQVTQVPTLAISLEPKGGAPAGSGPTGPVLFKGALLNL